MRNEKKTKKDSRIHPENADNNSRDKEKKTLKKQLDPPCKSQAIMVQSESSRGNRVPVGFPERKRKKRKDKNMQNIKNNTLTKKGESIMDFDNGIFRTVPHDTIDGVVWVVRIEDGEKITFCRTQSDVDFCVAELMKQRLAR